MIKNVDLWLAGMVGVALLMSGCGEFAYKTGAGADALQADQKTCRMSAGGEPGYKDCMNGKGWMVADLDGGGSTETSGPPPAAGSVSATSSSPDGPASMTAPTPVLRTSAPANPLTPISVSAWVKFGGNSPSDAISSCVVALGPAHQPDTTRHTVTAALLACMREKGWRAL
jgi:hypothetical protein